LLKRELLPLLRIITPNIAEAATLSGVDAFDERGMRHAAANLRQLGARAVLIKGGTWKRNQESEVTNPERTLKPSTCSTKTVRSQFFGAMDRSSAGARNRLHALIGDCGWLGKRTIVVRISSRSQTIRHAEIQNSKLTIQN
jgi:pyridoxal/pyridoxine/pyridoxamine kinase